MRMGESESILHWSEREARFYSVFGASVWFLYRKQQTNVWIYFYSALQLHTVAFVITDPTHFQQELTHMFVCVCVCVWERIENERDRTVQYKWDAFLARGPTFFPFHGTQQQAEGGGTVHTHTDARARVPFHTTNTLTRRTI